MPSPDVGSWPTPQQPDAFLQAVAFVIDSLEGGAAISRDEYGGLTKYGISERFHPDVDVRNLTRDRAAAIYRESYWNRFRCGLLPPAIGFLVFDMMVNPAAGENGVQALQGVLRVESDGVIGPDTVDAARRAPQTELLCRMTSRRLASYRREVQQHPPQVQYLDGWTYRACRALVFGSRLV